MKPLPKSGNCTAILETLEANTVFHDDVEGELSFPSHFS